MLAYHFLGRGTFLSIERRYELANLNQVSYIAIRRSTYSSFIQSYFNLDSTLLHKFILQTHIVEDLPEPKKGVNPLNPINNKSHSHTLNFLHQHAT